MKLLHPKIAELKKRAAPIQYSNVSVNEGGRLAEGMASDFENRIVAGYGVTWNTRNDYGEQFVKGCASKSINERGPQANAKMPIKMLNFHNGREPLALFETLEQDEVGLRFRTNPFDEVDYADRTLIHLRNKTVDNFSIGFNYVWDKLEYDEATESLIVLEMSLFEISPVSLAADPFTYALRNKQDKDEAVEELNDEIEAFIKCLPRKDQLEARTLFRRHKTLLETEPQTPRERALGGKKPTTVIDYNYLLKNFKK